MKKITVTIGIPAFNEEDNITSLIKQILSQKEKGFRMEKIIVNLDGSTDNTYQNIKSIRSKKVYIHNNLKRLGKPKRVNQLFEMSSSDVLVILDADTVLTSKNVIAQLVNPFIKNTKVTLTSGKAVPIKPNNFIQKIIYHGASMWRQTIDSLPTPNIYECEGEIRAFSKKLYKEITFPNSSAEDIYPYLYCVKKGYTFVSVKKAVVYYKLPTNLSDFVKQMKRFLKSKRVHSTNFNEKFINEQFIAKRGIKMKTFFFNLMQKPILTIMYICLLITPKFLAYFENKDTGMWQVISSTKKIK